MSDKNTISIIQITDTHLFANGLGLLVGMNTRESFDAIIADIQPKIPQTDVILATGDISQDDSESSYQYFAEKVGALGKPCYWLAGNHDIEAHMLNYMTTKPLQGDKNVHVGSWQLVLVNSKASNETHGELSDDELSFLDNALAASDAPNALIAIHHHVIGVNCAWLDNIDCRNKDKFWRIIERHPRVKLVINGHIHQAWEGEHLGVKVYGTPSTCAQFKPNQNNFGLDPIPPGYRQLSLFEDGTHQTEVIRLQNYDCLPDIQSAGY